MTDFRTLAKSLRAVFHDLKLLSDGYDIDSCADDVAGFFGVCQELASFVENETGSNFTDLGDDEIDDLVGGWFEAVADQEDRSEA